MKMNRKNIFIIFVIIILLSMGWFLFRFMNSDVVLTIEEEGFRAWLWQKRGLDLVVQVVLVFAGALGITAILPVEDEDA